MSGQSTLSDNTPTAAADEPRMKVGKTLLGWLLLHVIATVAMVHG